MLTLATGCTRNSPLVSQPPSGNPQTELQPVASASRKQAAKQLAGTGELYAAVVQMQLSIKDSVDKSDIIDTARLYEHLGELEEADSILTQSLQHRNSAVNISFALSQLRLKRGDFQTAAEALYPVLPTYTTLTDNSRLLLVRTLLLAGDADKVTSLLPAKAESSDWLSLIGLQRIISGRPNEAIQILKASGNQIAGDAFGAFLLGMAFKKSGDAKNALAAWKLSANLPDPPNDSLILAGTVLSATSDLDQAMAFINRLPPGERNRSDYWDVVEAVEKRRHNSVSAAISQGYSLYYSGNPIQAEAIWQKTLPTATGEDARELCAALYNSTFKREDSVNALKWTNEALKRFPDDTYFLKRRAEVLLGQGQIPASEADATKLEQIMPASMQGEIAELQCRIALDAGKPDLLKKSADRCRTLRPNDPDPFLHLAEWEEKKGNSIENRQAAMKLYQEAVKVDPKNADAFAHIGILQAGLQQTDDATKTLLHALTLWPRVMEGAPHAQLSQIYQRTGKTAEAKFHAEQYQKLRRVKERWPTLLKALRQDVSLAEWKELADMALYRRENWIARCAIHRWQELAPNDPAVWHARAAVDKREGLFGAALDDMLHARKLSTGTAKAKGVS